MLSRVASSLVRQRAVMRPSMMAARCMSTGDDTPTLEQDPTQYNIENVMFPPESWKAAPHNTFGTNGQYASALFRCAITKSDAELKAVHKDVQAFINLLDTDEPFHELKADVGTADKPEMTSNEISLKDYIGLTDIPREEKVVALADLAAKQKYSPITLGFLQTAAHNGRLKHVPLIYKEFEDFVNAHSGVTTATVTSAVDLTAAQKKKVEAALAKQASGSMSVTYKVDADIVGGLVIECGTDFSDMSLVSAVNNAKDSVAKSVNEAHESAVGAMETAGMNAGGIKDKSSHDAEPYKLDHLLKREQSAESVAEYIAAFESLKASFESVEAAGGWKSKIPFDFKVDYGVPKEEEAAALEK